MESTLFIFYYFLLIFYFGWLNPWPKFNVGLDSGLDREKLQKKETFLLQTLILTSIQIPSTVFVSGLLCKKKAVWVFIFVFLILS